MTDDYDTDTESVQENAERRSIERGRRSEDVVNEVTERLSRSKFPTTSEELAIEYGGEEIELPNETESLGSVFDRMEDTEFESPSEAREALFNELSGDAGGMEEYNDQRNPGVVEEGTDTDKARDTGASDM